MAGWLRCLARNVYFEARGEPEAGQYAVAEVTMNRKVSGRYPNTVCGVVYERQAFSWTAVDILPEPEGEAWSRAQEIAEEFSTALLRGLIRDETVRVESPLGVDVVRST